MRLPCWEATSEGMVRMTVTALRQWQVRLNVAGWWGAWVDVAAEDADRAFEAACEAYVLDGHDSRLMNHVNESRIVETPAC